MSLENSASQNRASAAARLRRPVRRLVGAAAMILLILCGGVVAWYVNQPTPLQRAASAIQRGDIASAQSILRELTKQTPVNAEACLLLAGTLQATEPHAAIGILQAIPETDAQSAKAMQEIARIALGANQYSIAETALLKLIDLEPSNLNLRLALAELYFNNGRSADALPHARKCIELADTRAMSYVLYAEILDELHRPLEMITPLEKALELDPSNLTAQANLAYAYHSAGDNKQAELLAEQCLQRDSTLANVRVILASALRHQGDRKAARQQVDKALQQSPENLDALLLKTDLLLYEREAEAAYHLLRPVESKHANNRQLLSYLMRAAQQTGRSEEAQVLQTRLIDATPDRTSQEFVDHDVVAPTTGVP